MTFRRSALFAVLGLRVAYGAALIAAPRPLTRRGLGPPADQKATQILARALGAREILLHAGAIASAVRGGRVRPWLAASIAGDLTDIASTVAARDGVPAQSPPATIAVAGGSALLSGLVAAAASD